MTTFNAVAVANAPQMTSVFGSQDSFELAQRMATALSRSDLVPDQYKGNVANALIALEVANRIGASPLMVMQNLYIVHGRPSWSATFVISAINSSGRFSPLRYVFEGEGDNRSCYAWATDNTGERLEGPKVTMAMAKAEKWTEKAGSKWKTMPELMMRYRAATFFGRAYAPELLMGMRTADEENDIRASREAAARRPRPAEVVIETEAEQVPANVDADTGEILAEWDEVEVDPMLAALAGASLEDEAP